MACALSNSHGLDTNDTPCLPQKNLKSVLRVAAMLMIISIQLTRYNTIREWIASYDRDSGRPSRSHIRVPGPMLTRAKICSNGAYSSCSLSTGTDSTHSKNRREDCQPILYHPCRLLKVCLDISAQERLSAGFHLEYLVVDLS
jgi:hypothetical protein